MEFNGSFHSANSSLENYLNEKDELEIVPKFSDVFFRKTFKLQGTDEVVLCHEIVTYFGKFDFEVEIFVSQHYLAFYEKIFHYCFTLLVPFWNIESIQQIQKPGVNNNLIRIKIISEANSNKETLIQTTNQEFFKYLKKWLEENKTDTTFSVQKFLSSQSKTKKEFERELLRNIPENNREIKLHFNGLSKDDAEKMAQESKLGHFMKNQVLVQEGQQIKGLYQVAKGVVRIEKGGKIIATMDRGQIFGEVSFLHNGLALGSVIANCDEVVIYFLKAEILNQWFHENPSLKGYFHHFLAKVLARRVLTSSIFLASQSNITETDEKMRQFKKVFKQDGSFIAEMQCIYNDRVEGSLYLASTFLGFVGKFFGELKQSWPIVDINPVKEGSNSVLFQITTTIRFTFQTTTDRDHMMYLISKAQELSSRRNSLTHIYEEDFIDLLKEVEVKEYEPNQKILEEGTVPRGIYQIASGSVRVEKGNVRLAVMHEGETFGEMNFLLGGLVSSSVVAEKKTKLFLLESDKLTSILQSDPSIATSFFKNMCFILANRLKHSSVAVVVGSLEKIVDYGEVKIMKDRKTGVVKDKAFRKNKKGGKSFSGEKLVRWLIKHKMVNSKEEGIIYGRRLLTTEVIQIAVKHVEPEKNSNHDKNGKQIQDSSDSLSFSLKDQYKFTSEKDRSTYFDFAELNINGKWKLCWVLISKDSLRIFKASAKENQNVLIVKEVRILDILEISFPSLKYNQSASYLKLDLTGNSLILKNENLAQSVSLASAIYNLSYIDFQQKVKVSTFEWLSLPKKKSSELEQEWKSLAKKKASKVSNLINEMCLIHGYKIEHESKAEFCKHSPKLEEIDNNAAYYKKFLSDNPHFIFLALRGDIIVAWVIIEDPQSDRGEFIRALVHSARGVDKVRCPRVHLKIPTIVYARFSTSGVSNTTLDVTRWIELPPENSIKEKLFTYESKVTATHQFKFGVLYAKEGQTENQMFSNKTSESFEKFLSCLGTKIELKNWQKYSGNLDIEKETSGTRSYYTEFQENEIMFHVSTLLPKKMNENPIEIKKYFGNDIVVIVFFEGKKTFDPSLVVSNFNQVFIVVHGKEKKGKPIYQVSVVFKPGIMPCSPPIPPTPFTSDHSFTEWILTKAINCEHAAMYAKELYDKQIKIRKCLLQTIKDVAEPYITNEKVTTE